MVGLPARGKSYITKKLAKYLNWLQHDTKIFNVGDRRRIAARALDNPINISKGKFNTSSPSKRIDGTGLLSPRYVASFKHSGNREQATENSRLLSSCPEYCERIEGGADQSAAFFGPNNKAAAELRERVAMETLDELLHYVLYGGGSVGILDATNSTLTRRKTIMEHIREVAGSDLGVVFLESVCHDENLLAANMRLKLSGPDYRGSDPVKALEDFGKRVEVYQRNYVPLGDYEERSGLQYIKIIDVGRKLVTHQIRGFLAAQTVSYLLSFHLSPRLICVTRHGESVDNVAGKIGGDALLSDRGRKYARALAQFAENQRKLFHGRQLEKHYMAHMPSVLGNTTPPNPEFTSYTGGCPDGLPQEKNFCVWTSWLSRAIDTAQNFNEEDYDVKQMKMLNELNAGIAEGYTYDEIKQKWPHEYAARRADKLHYRYPGSGGESYLDVIARLKPVIVEIERMQDHVLLITHRVVTRILLAYFLGLDRDDVAKLEVPLEMVYVLEPVGNINSLVDIPLLILSRSHMVLIFVPISMTTLQKTLVVYRITSSKMNKRTLDIRNRFTLF